MAREIDFRRVRPDVTVRWRPLSENDLGWDSVRCLYAYVAPDLREILYIGKASGVTVGGRWVRSAKLNFWDDLERLRRIDRHAALLGEVELNYSGRFSAQLLADVESLLIAAEQPWGNIQSKRSRITRPGLAVACVGAWPKRSCTYIDNA